MKVSLEEVSAGPKNSALEPTSLTYESGRVTIAYVATESRPTVLGLLASGRMKPASGTISLDDRADARAVRSRVALVDAPDVSAPEPNLSLAGVMSDELAFAGYASGPLHARKFLKELGITENPGIEFDRVHPATRFRLLCETALRRPNISGIVLVTPDRHGGVVKDWWTLTHDLADRGYAVLVILGQGSRDVVALHEGYPSSPVPVMTDYLRAGSGPVDSISAEPHDTHQAAETTSDDVSRTDEFNELDVLRLEEEEEEEDVLLVSETVIEVTVEPDDSETPTPAEGDDTEEKTS